MTDKRIAKRPPDSLFQLVTDRWTEPFWDAAREKRLVCAQCSDCGHKRMPPTPFCPTCRSQRIDWIELPGSGVVYAYTIVERGTLPGMEDCLPYVPAVIEPDGGGGTRLISNIVDSPVADIAVGVRVDIVFDTLAKGAVVPRFRLLGFGK